MRIISFSKRNLKELLRDPLSYIFCLGFPIAMLVIMTVINNSIPKEANMTIFRIDNLSHGIAVFGLSFIMLFAALLLSKDRKSAFLTRLYASPMKAGEFIGGYYLPLLLLAAAQILIAYTASVIIGAADGFPLNIERAFLSAFTLLLPSVMFIGFGLLFGSLFSENAAPGLCSVIISGAGILGGIWMDVETIGGGLKVVCEALPFYHAVRAARNIYAGNANGLAADILITVIYTVASVIFSVLAFSNNMTRDNK